MWRVMWTIDRNGTVLQEMWRVLSYICRHCGVGVNAHSVNYNCNLPVPSPFGISSAYPSVQRLHRQRDTMLIWPGVLVYQTSKALLMMMHPGNTLEIRVVERCAGADRGESSKCLKLTYHKIHTSIHLLPFSDIVPTDPSLCAPTDRVENITKYVVWQWCDWTNVDGRVPTEVMSMSLLMGLGQKAAFSMFVGIRA